MWCAFLTGEREQDHSETLVLGENFERKKKQKSDRDPVASFKLEQGSL
jgi:hypothetical protein